MSQTIQEKNKALVLEAFDTLFNKRDYVAAEKYWSPNYIQHSAHIEPGRDGLFNLIRNTPPPCVTNINSSSRRTSTSSCTDDSQEPAGLLPGSPPILSGSRTAGLPNTGMCYKTRRQKPNRRAACQCSAIASPPERIYPSKPNQRNLYENAAFGLVTSDKKKCKWLACLIRSRFEK